jgi:hypothetical protein
MVKAALAAASDTRRPATINRSTNRAPPTTIKATAPTSAMPATITPTTRATPRRRKPYQAEALAISTQPNRARPRGNWFIATAMASASVAAATTSAKIAVSRLIAFDFPRQRCQLRCDCPHPTPAPSSAMNCPHPRLLQLIPIDRNDRDSQRPGHHVNRVRCADPGMGLPAPRSLIVVASAEAGALPCTS